MNWRMRDLHPALKLDKKRVVVRSVSLFVLVLFFSLPGYCDETEIGNCQKCHDFSPGNENHEKFFPGAHWSHRKISCDLCHLKGGTKEHLDGQITLLPEVGYSLGTDVPWPNRGPGSCGGKGALPMLGGCHPDAATKRCFWHLGDSCIVESLP